MNGKFLTLCWIHQSEFSLFSNKPSANAQHFKSKELKLTIFPQPDTVSLTFHTSAKVECCHLANELANEDIQEQLTGKMPVHQACD